MTMTIALLILGLAIGYIVGSKLEERACRSTIAASLARISEVESQAQAAIAAERAYAHQQVSQASAMTTELVGEARKSIAESRMMMSEAVDITKQATALVLPVTMGPDDSGPQSITEADRARARQQKQDEARESRQGR